MLSSFSYHSPTWVPQTYVMCPTRVHIFWNLRFLHLRSSYLPVLTTSLYPQLPKMARRRAGKAFTHPLGFCINCGRLLAEQMCVHSCLKPLPESHLLPLDNKVPLPPHPEQPLLHLALLQVICGITPSLVHLAVSPQSWFLGGSIIFFKVQPGKASGQA